jgi:hypothetical protein
MITRFPVAPAGYSSGFLNLFFSQLQQLFNRVVAKDEESPRIILRSSIGKLYEVRVSDIGRLYTAEVDGAPIILPVVFGARMTAGQAIGTTAAVPAYDTPTDNLGNYFDPATGRFAPPSGVYDLSASVGTVTVGNNAELYVGLFKNGIEVLRGASSASPAGISISASASASVTLNAGDYVEARIWSDRTGHVTDAVASAFGAYGQIIGDQMMVVS